MDIARVYIGLPSHLDGKIVWCELKRRKNPLSFTPGGSDVIVEWSDNRVTGYDRVKYPSHYVKEIFREELKVILPEKSKPIRSSDIKIIRDKMVSVFARKYANDQEYSATSFQKVWNSNASIAELFKSLEKFDEKKKFDEKIVFQFVASEDPVF